MKQRLPGRIIDIMLGAPKDGLPGYICRKCKRKLECLENAAEEFDIFRSEARATHDLCSGFGGTADKLQSERNRSILLLICVPGI